jgi:hypothetical protein
MIGHVVDHGPIKIKQEGLIVRYHVSSNFLQTSGKTTFYTNPVITAILFFKEFVANQISLVF